MTDPEAIPMILELLNAVDTKIDHLNTRVAQQNGRVATLEDAHFRQLEQAQVGFESERDRRITEVGTERDRRYAEVAEERSKALEIKQIADAKALELAAEIQTYKDQQADQLRSVTVNAQGNRAGRDQVLAWFIGSGAIGAALAGVITYVATKGG